MLSSKISLLVDDVGYLPTTMLEQGTSSHIRGQRRSCRMRWNFNCRRNWTRCRGFHQRRWGAVEIRETWDWEEPPWIKRNPAPDLRMLFSYFLLRSWRFSEIGNPVAWQREVDLLLVPPPLERLKRPAWWFQVGSLWFRSGVSNLQWCFSLVLAWTLFSTQRKWDFG